MEEQIQKTIETAFGIRNLTNGGASKCGTVSANHWYYMHKGSLYSCS